MMDDRKKINLKEHLEWASQTVSTWPAWKQILLGGKVKKNQQKKEDSTTKYPNSIDCINN